MPATDGHGVGDVGVGGEEAAEAHDADQDGQPDLEPLERAELPAEAGIGVGLLERHEPPQHDQRDDADQADQQEQQPPAVALAEPRGERDADDIGHGQAGHDHRDRPAPLGRSDQGGGDDGRNAEEGAVGQACREPGHQHGAVVRGDEGREVGDAEEEHESQGQILPRHPGADGGQHRRADDDAEGVGRDQVAGLRGADVQALLHLLEQAHHGEFGGADAESAHGQGNDGKGKMAGAGFWRGRGLLWWLSFVCFSGRFRGGRQEDCGILNLMCSTSRARPVFPGAHRDARPPPFSPTAARRPRLGGVTGLINVVGGAVVDSLAEPARLLVARRTAPPQFAGMWEFPGGKVEPGETPSRRLQRELLEELGVTVRLGAELPASSASGWPLNERAAMRVWFAELADGEPRPLQDHDELRWIDVRNREDGAGPAVDPGRLPHCRGAPGHPGAAGCSTMNRMPVENPGRTYRAKQRQ